MCYYRTQHDEINTCILAVAQWFLQLSSSHRRFTDFWLPSQSSLEPILPLTVVHHGLHDLLLCVHYKGTYMQQSEMKTIFKQCCLYSHVCVRVHTHNIPCCTTGSLSGWPAINTKCSCSLPCEEDMTTTWKCCTASYYANKMLDLEHSGIPPPSPQLLL